MKKIIAIIRNECVGPSRSALETIGIWRIAVLAVMWQKRQNRRIARSSLESWRGTNNDRFGPVRKVPSGTDVSDHEVQKTEPSSSFLPRSMLVMAVADTDVLPVIRALAGTARAGCHNEGRIYVCPIVTAVGIGSI